MPFDCFVYGSCLAKAPFRSPPKPIHATQLTYFTRRWWKSSEHVLVWYYVVLVLLFAGMAGIIQTKKSLRNQIHTQSYTQIRTVKRVRERDGAYEPNHESRRIKTNKSTENTERFFYVKLCYTKLSLGLYELVRSIYFLCWFVRFLVCVVVWFFASMYFALPVRLG